MTIEEIAESMTKQKSIHETATKIVDLLNGIGAAYDDEAREEVLRLVTEDAE